MLDKYLNGFQMSLLYAYNVYKEKLTTVQPWYLWDGFKETG
jgi:hypothetical protein